jgi:hypothetical protein
MADKTQKSMPDFDSDEDELYTLLGKPCPSCPPLDMLLAYSEDVLPVEQKETLRAHLMDCRLCPQLLADLATLPEPELSNAQLDRIRGTLPAQSGRHTASNLRLYSFVGIAAALVLVAFLTFGLRFHRQSSPSVASTVSASVPKTVAILEIPISPLPPPEGMLLSRGSQSDGNPSVDMLMSAFAAYNRGDYEAATTRFTSLRSRYPRSEIVSLYLGIAQLYLQQNAEAYATLISNNESAHPNLANARSWYAAVAAERTQSANAAQLFAEICANHASPWSIQSCKIESQLR